MRFADKGRPGWGETPPKALGASLGLLGRAAQGSLGNRLLLLLPSSALGKECQLRCPAAAKGGKEGRKEDRDQAI